MNIQRIFSIIIIALVAVAGAAQAEWRQVGEARFSSGKANYLNLALDSNGTPYIAYSDDNGIASVMKFNGTSWVTVGNTAFSIGTATDISLAIGSKSTTPYVAYKDGANGNKVSVAKLDGVSWVNVGNAAISAGEAADISIAVDNNGIPYVAYSECVDIFCFDTEANVMKLKGTSWEKIGNTSFTTAQTNYLRLAVDSNGTPYVAYQDGANSDKASVMKFNSSSSSWEQVGAAGFSAAEANYLSLALDSMGTPYVAYQDTADENKVKVMKLNDSNWLQVGSEVGLSVDLSTINDGISLVIGKGNIPYVAYSDADNGGKASARKFDGSGWVQVGTTGFSADVADYISFALNSSNIPYVAYKDAADNSDKASVMMQFDSLSAMPWLELLLRKK